MSEELKSRRQIYDRIRYESLRYRLALCPADPQLLGELFIPSVLPLHAHVADPIPERLEWWKRQYAFAKLRQGSPQALPYFDDEMDYVVTDSLSRLKRPEMVLKEMLRVLKPGGYLLLFQVSDVGGITRNLAAEGLQPMDQGSMTNETGETSQWILIRK